MIHTETVSDTEVHERAARSIADALGAACEERGRCSLALSGGTTPKAMFARLAELDVPWESVDVFQVDERVAPRGHPDRNLTLIERELGERVVGLHEMPVEVEDLETATERYAVLLEQRCGSPPAIDVVHLGLGTDGHTASLVPGDPVLEVRDRWVAVTQPYEGYRRMTLTFPVLDEARLVMFLVTEAAKANVLKATLEGDTSLPAARLRSRETIFFTTPGVSDAR